MRDSKSESLQFSSAAEWRAWLVEHHTQTASVYLAIAKKGAEARQNAGLSYEAAVEEAICFGWVDGQARSLDDRLFLLLFSPRRTDSVWSVSNIERVRRLTLAGRMAAAGLAAAEAAKANGQWDAALRRELVDVIPEDLEAALLELPGAREAYLAMTPSRRKQLLGFLDAAKRPETRARRIRAIVDEVQAQGRVGG
ncbi:MAG: YdeI/OmpD-associated family protein [Anaerolineae bacterium]|nr:YdeI/OmpD-associated family protein [Anaerolineae bacterium]